MAADLWLHTFSLPLLSVSFRDRQDRLLTTWYGVWNTEYAVELRLVLCCRSMADCLEGGRSHSEDQ
jgi:hypothetical protein